MFDPIIAALTQGRAVPYLGPAVLSLAGENCTLPAGPQTLVGRLTAAASVPHKIRNNLTAAAQFIENFKHRKTVSKVLSETFRSTVPPTDLHRQLAALPRLAMLVHAWYDDLPQRALAGRAGWGMAQGVSQAEHSGGEWVHYFNADGSAANAEQAASWPTLLYQPLGSVTPAANFLVSDSDFVEVLTEIDIQTPIPKTVQERRDGRNFLFLGCRFDTQVDRAFASQIIKRSSDRHWAVLPETPTKNEARFLAQHNIQRIDVPLSSFVETLAAGLPQPATA